MEILLSILLEHEIHLQHLPQTEKEVRSTASQRQIRMDVWAKDDEAAEQSGSLRIKKLQQKVNAIKSSEDMGVKYMQAWEEKVMDRQEGFQEGHSQGLTEGFGRGRSRGLEEGHSRGLKEGLAAGFSALSALVQKGTLSLEQAAESLNGRGDDFLKWYEQGS